MSHFYDFPSDKMDVFEFNIDSSGSMSGDTENVKKGLEMYKKSFEGFSEANSIVVAIMAVEQLFVTVLLRELSISRNIWKK